MQQTLRRHSVESTGSAAREFNAYHQYRQQMQTQSDANSSSDDAEREVCAIRHHNPVIEAASTISRDHLAPTELRQRVSYDSDINVHTSFLHIEIPF